jgi:hypothetical protein
VLVLSNLATDRGLLKTRKRNVGTATAENAIGSGDQLFVGQLAVAVLVVPVQWSRCLLLFVVVDC